MNVHWAKWAVWASALLTFTSTAFIVAIAANPEYRGFNEECTFSKFQKQVAGFGTSLTAECIEQFYDAMRDRLGLVVAYALFNSIAVVLFLPAILTVARAHEGAFEVSFMVPSFALAAVLSGVELLQIAGESSTSDWLSSKDWNLNDDGLRTLTIAQFVTEGQDAWIFAFDSLVVGVGVISLSIATYRYGRLPSWHAHFGLVIGALSFLGFILAVARFGNWSIVSAIEGIVAALNGFILIPIWLAWLGWVLPTLDLPTGASLLSSGAAAPSSLDDSGGI